MRRHWIRGIAIAALLANCGPSKNGSGHDGGTGDVGNGPHVLSGLSVTPTNPIVQLDLNTTGSQVFVVDGLYEDGTTEDLTSQATLTVVNLVVGTMTGATLAIPAFNSTQANTSLIKASALGFTAQAQITVAAYRSSGPKQDFFFVLPYQDSSGAQTKPLDFSTAIPALDVFFLMDTTGSMYGEISNLKTSLSGTVVPQIQAALANTHFGVGAFEDFPDDGDSNGRGPDGTLDQPFKLRQAITGTTASVQTALDGLITGTSPIGGGGDGPEAGIEALYQVATGDGLSSPSPTSVPAHHTGVGGVGFRTGVMPVIVSISDAASHTNGSVDPNSCGLPYQADVDAVAHTNAQTKAALNAICARVVGIAPVTGVCDAESYYTDFATATGARVPPAAWDVGTRPAGCSSTQCCIGQNGEGMAVDNEGLCPLVFRASTTGTLVSTSVVTGIQMLTRFAQFDVTHVVNGLTADNSGVALPAGHTTADFVKSITPTSFMVPPGPPVVPNPTFDATNFHGVTPGTTVDFNVSALNDFIPSTDQAQIFSATIQVLAGACTPLDQRSVLILVPPTAIVVE
jgi:hypothetical protein